MLLKTQLFKSKETRSEYGLVVTRQPIIGFSRENKAWEDANAAFTFNQKGISALQSPHARATSTHTQAITPPAGSTTANARSNIMPSLSLAGPAIPNEAHKYTFTVTAASDTPPECANTGSVNAATPLARTNSAPALANGPFELANAAKLYTNDAKLYTNAANLCTNGAKLYTNAAKIYTNVAKYYTNGAKKYANDATYCANGAELYTNDVKIYANAANKYAYDAKSQSCDARKYTNGANLQSNAANLDANRAPANSNDAHVDANDALTRANGPHEHANITHEWSYSATYKPYLRFTRINATKLKSKIYQFNKETNNGFIWIWYLILFREIVNRFERT
ncbi:MAG: hypothetical protein NT166_32420 [Candidatus Aminicenantes bacterium]|nr:hypothetical protein [Candidatus Aminicenantes bacterium]